MLDIYAVSRDRSLNIQLTPKIRSQEYDLHILCAQLLCRAECGRPRVRQLCHANGVR